MNLVSLFLLLSSVFLASCAPRVGPAYIFHRDHPIEIELKDFSFRPNHFVVLKDQSLLFSFSEIRMSYGTISLSCLPTGLSS